MSSEQRERSTNISILFARAMRAWRNYITPEDVDGDRAAVQAEVLRVVGRAAIPPLGDEDMPLCSRVALTAAFLHPGEEP